MKKRKTGDNYSDMFLQNIGDYVWACYCYCLQGSVTQGVPCTVTITNLLCFAAWVLIIPDSPARALWQ
jgi:hypothetical protein